VIAEIIRRVVFNQILEHRSIDCIHQDETSPTRWFLNRIHQHPPCWTGANPAPDLLRRGMARGKAHRPLGRHECVTLGDGHSPTARHPVETECNEQPSGNGHPTIETNAVNGEPCDQAGATHQQIDGGGDSTPRIVWKLVLADVARRVKIVGELVGVRVDEVGLRIGLTHGAQGTPS